MPWTWSRATLVVCLLVDLACTGEIVGTPGQGDTTQVDAGDRGKPDDAAVRPDAADLADPAVLFAAEVDPLLRAERPRGSCTSCHEGTDPTNGPDFLGSDPDGHYESLTRAPRILGLEPEASLLFTRGTHAGDEFCAGPDAPYAGCVEDEVAVVANWIQVQAAAAPER